MDKLEIAVIDDAREDLLLAERVVRQCGIVNPVSLYDSGGKVLSYYGPDGPGSKTNRPLLMLVDLVMQPVTGLQLLETWRRLPVSARSFAIILSGYNSLKQVNEAYQLGAKTFLLKPLKPSDLIRALEGFPGDLHLERNGAGAVIRWMHHPPMNLPPVRATA